MAVVFALTQFLQGFVIANHRRLPEGPLEEIFMNVVMTPRGLRAAYRCVTFTPAMAAHTDDRFSSTWDADGTVLERAASAWA